MIAAITELEARGFNVSTGQHLHEHVTWQDIVDARNAAIRSNPKARAQYALRQLMILLLDVQRERRTAHEAATEAIHYVNQDSDNLIARLVCATLLDMQPAAQQPDGPTIIRRFERMRGIIERNPRATRTTLYNSEFRQTFQSVISKYVSRPDVAVGLSESIPQNLIDEHYAALSTVRSHLADMAAELREQGHTEESDTCLRWIGQAALGLMATDSHAGTRLFCAELLAETLGEEAPAAKDLKRLRSDFHDAVRRAPKDLCTHAPAFDADAYKSAFHRLVAACVLALSALGAAALFVGAGIANLIKVVLRRGIVRSSAEKRCPVWAKTTIALLPTFALALLIVAKLTTNGPYSTIWAITLAVVVVLVGALLAVALAGIATTTDSKAAKRRLALSAFLLIAVGLIAAAPPHTITRYYRWLDINVGMAWIIVLGPLVVVIAACLLSPARLRTITAAAALVWCLNIAAAFVALQFHRAADKHYQQTVVAGSLDEIATRLGPDWQEQYIAPARQAFGDDPR
ncbi:MAG: hypothetical protein JXQ75_07570 [Phycisphaerae bacterium]|nr:hypothetical protein [Phycisphaerae bacterium]